MMTRLHEKKSRFDIFKAGDGLEQAGVDLCYRGCGVEGGMGVWGW